MIHKDYRLLKANDATTINVDGNQPVLERVLFNQTTGAQDDIRSDVIDVPYLTQLRADLVDQVKDLNRLLIDTGIALDEKANGMQQPVEEP